MLSTGAFNVRASAVDSSMIFYNVVGSTIASAIPKILEKIYDIITRHDSGVPLARETCVRTFRKYRR